MEKIQAELALTGFCIPLVPQLLKFKPFGKGWGGALRCSLTGLGLGMYAATVTLLSLVSCLLFSVSFVSLRLGKFRFDPACLLHHALYFTISKFRHFDSQLLILYCSSLISSTCSHLILVLLLMGL